MPQRGQGFSCTTPANGSKERRARRAAAACQPGGAGDGSETSTAEATQPAPSERTAPRSRQ
eukprot:10765994-Alexandrium_andersonii.AAC.1